jgi:hypothetical protein
LKITTVRAEPLCKDPLNPCIDLHYDQLLAPETRSIYLNLVVAYSPIISSSRLAIATTTSSSLFITNTCSSSSHQATPCLRATSENCPCCRWSCDTSCWKYIISWSFRLRSDFQSLFVLESVFSRTGILYSSGVTMSR